MSGVPQGLVLGPCPFWYYINDMPENLSPLTTVRLCTDDTIAYLTVTLAQDTELLQPDLNKLGKWECKWQVGFHLQKCRVLNITSMINPMKYLYNLHGH